MKVDLKSFETLEHKIQRTVELVSRLKDENSSLRDENLTLRSQVTSLQSAANDGVARARELDTVRETKQQLEKELQVLQDERQTVLARVDGLLENLSRLPLD